MPNAAEILVDPLIAWNVEVVFGLPGDGINGVMEARRKNQDKISFVQVRHEESAAFIACAYEPMMQPKMPPDYAKNFHNALPQTPGRDLIAENVARQPAGTMMEAGE